MRHAARSALISLTAAAAAIAGAAQAQTSPPTPTSKPAAPAAVVPAPPMFSGPEYAMGDPRAKVTVVEYGSASCSHCARFDIAVFPAFKARYIDTGKVRYVFREFLTDQVQLAAGGFLLARCAGEANYWKVLEEVFRAQAEIYQTQSMQAPFYRIAASVGLKPAQVDACLSNKPAIDALNARVEDAIKKEKIDGTPTFFINGKMAFSGEVDLARLSAAIDPLLAGKPKPRPAHSRTH